MATSAGELVDRVRQLAQISALGRQTNVVAADAARALGHVGRALRELHRGGVAPRVGAEREKLVEELAASCAEIADRSPDGSSTLEDNAAAAADAVAVAALQTTTAGRWAMATELLDIATALNSVVAAAPIGSEIDRRCVTVHECAVKLQRDAALHPPEPRHFEALDRPIPTPGLAGVSDLSSAVRESAAQLIHASEQHETGLTVAQVLARTIAAEALAGAAETCRDGHPSPPTVATVSAASWRAVRAALQPFDDGSRRPQPRSDEPGISAALRLHAALQRSGDPVKWQPSMRNAVAASVQLLPTLARQLERTVHRWVNDGSLVAHACDLTYQDGRAHAYLAGHTQAGIIRVLTPSDLEPATRGLQRAGLLSAALAGSLGDRPSIDPTSTDHSFPRHLAASHRATVEQTSPLDMSSAAHRAYEQLQAVHAAPSPRRQR